MYCCTRLFGTIGDIISNSHFMLCILLAAFTLLHDWFLEFNSQISMLMGFSYVHLLAAQNNYQTKHLAKILIHLVWCLQECTSTTSASSVAYRRAINAAYISSIFLKFIIENAKTDNWQELCLDIDKSEKGMEKFPAGNWLFTSSLVCCKGYLLCKPIYANYLLL